MSLYLLTFTVKTVIDFDDNPPNMRKAPLLIKVQYMSVEFGLFMT